MSVLGRVKDSFEIALRLFSDGFDDQRGPRKVLVSIHLKHLSESSTTCSETNANIKHLLTSSTLRIHQEQRCYFSISYPFILDTFVLYHAATDYPSSYSAILC